MKKRDILAIYLLYLAFQFLGFFFFFKGFFKLPHESHKKSETTNIFLNKTNWFEPLFNKSIWMIIDGLRYDFAYTSPPNNNDNKETLPFYINQMPFITTLLKEKPNQSFFFQAHSDPPTVTTQRIKSLTTGNLPSFLEFTDNFSGKEVFH